MIGVDEDTLGDTEQCRDKLSQWGSKVRSLVDVGTKCALGMLGREDAGITLGDGMGEDGAG